MIFTTIVANLLVTLAALLLIKRRPSRRLRILTLIVGLMSLAQTASYIDMHERGHWRLIQNLGVHQALVAGLSIAAIYLLGLEVHDRRVMERQVRLMEHELSPKCAMGVEGKTASQGPVEQVYAPLSTS
jgi:hypothetical protein